MARNARLGGVWWAMPRGRRGVSLMEVVMVMAIMGILVSIATPRLDAYIRRERVRSALNRVAGDLEFTRILAVRSGAPAVLRFTAHPRCPKKGGAGYVIRLRGNPAPARVAYPPDDYLVCYTSTNSDSVTFGSRGLLAPYNNRTLRAIDGPFRDSLTVSAVGRVYRRF